MCKSVWMTIKMTMCDVFSYERSFQNLNEVNTKTKKTQEKLKSYKRLRANCLNEVIGIFCVCWSAKMGKKDKFVSRCCRLLFSCVLSSAMLSVSVASNRTQPILLSFVISSLHSNLISSMRGSLEFVRASLG